MTQTEYNEAALRTTINDITADDKLAEEAGIGSISASEVIAVPNLADYQAPDYIAKTAPGLKPILEQLLCELYELNEQYAGTSTLQAQALLSFSGEHEVLEDRFFQWCRTYFGLRGNLGNLSPEVGNDPWRLYQKCYGEFGRLIEARIVQVGTLNADVLNLSQRYMQSHFARDVLGQDLKRFYMQESSSRFSSELNLARAHDQVSIYEKGVQNYREVISHLSENLPPEYSISSGAEWEQRLRLRVPQLAEDLSTFRNLKTLLVPEGPTRRQLTPNLWATLRWDVYHGRSVATVLTSRSADVTSENSTVHSLSIRRDGWLCNREFSWIRVDPDIDYDNKLSELAVNYYLLDLLTRPLYEAWDKCDVSKVIERGIEPDATEEEKNSALAAAVATAVVEDEDDEESVNEPTEESTKGYKLGVLTVRKYCKILKRDFDCKVSQGKGSEIKITRLGGRYCNVRCHGDGDKIWPEKMRDCLVRLNISESSFIRSLCKQHER